MVNFQEISSKFQLARQESNESITFDCTICAVEGHNGKRVKLYTNGAMSCSRFASAGVEANREHCRPIREMLSIGEQPAKFISETLLDGKLKIECSPADRGKVRLVARNCD